MLWPVPTRWPVLKLDWHRQRNNGVSPSCQRASKSFVESVFGVQEVECLNLLDFCLWFRSCRPVEAQGVAAPEWRTGKWLIWIGGLIARPNSICDWVWGIASHSRETCPSAEQNLDIFDPLRLTPHRLDQVGLFVFDGTSVNLHVSICTYMDLDIIYNRIWSKYTAIYILCVYACIYVFARTARMYMYVYVCIS
jgi:hypothetical protein